MTRLVGIEPHPTQPTLEIRTYGCGRCEHMSTQDVSRRDAGMAH